MIGFLVVLLQGHAFGDDLTREWSNTEGKKITAEYLGVRGDSIIVRMSGKRVVAIPLSKLSDADKAFVSSRPLVYQEEWLSWPEDAETPVKIVDVTETKADGQNYVYQTSHFRFQVDGNLGTPLMKDLAQVFELTYSLHTKSPFGLLAKPKNDRFEARLFGETETYRDRGGPETTAGVYLPKTKVFLAPLDLMGVKVDSGVWRRIPRTQCDTTTVVHELTHMLTHDMLVTLPIWVNEGYAEYIASIPIERDAFRVSGKKIREGVIDRFVLDYEKWCSSSGGRIDNLGRAERLKFIKNKIPKIPPVATVLGITDKKWMATPSKSLRMPGDTKFTYPQKLGLYRTSLLIIYYFLHLDGEKGISKLRRYVMQKQQKAAELADFCAAHEEYQRQMEHFLKLPGVEALEGGRFRYPSNLTPPAAPKPPFKNAEQFAASGMEILFDGETPEALGRKIEQALTNDLGLPLDFSMSITQGFTPFVPLNGP